MRITLFPVVMQAKDIKRSYRLSYKGKADSVVNEANVTGSGKIRLHTTSITTTSKDAGLMYYNSRDVVEVLLTTSQLLDYWDYK